jgi:hypothetical protein
VDRALTGTLGGGRSVRHDDRARPRRSVRRNHAIMLSSRLTDTDQCSRWRFAATATELGRTTPADLTCTYHGVYRHRGYTTTWLTMTATVRRTQGAMRRRRRPLVLRAELTASEPAPTPSLAGDYGLHASGMTTSASAFCPGAFDARPGLFDRDAIVDASLQRRDPSRSLTDLTIARRDGVSSPAGGSPGGTGEHCGSALAVPSPSRLPSGGEAIARPPGLRDIGAARLRCGSRDHSMGRPLQAEDPLIHSPAMAGGPFDDSSGGASGGRPGVGRIVQPRCG